MRQVFLDRGSVVVKEVCQPHIEENQVLVSVHYSFLGSGAEISAIEKTQESAYLGGIQNKIRRVLRSVAHNNQEDITEIIKNKVKGPMQALGYSCSGKVIAVGNKVKNVKDGDFVACAGANFAKHADIILMPQNLVAKVKNQEFLKHASLTTVGALALQSIRRANLQIGDHVCVIGLGVLGQLISQMANLSGCNVIGLDLLEERIATAKTIGAITAFHAIEDNVINEIDFITDHKGVDCTIIAASSKSDSIVHQAMEITRKNGKVIIVSDVGLNIEKNCFYKKEIELIVSCSYGPGRDQHEYEHLGRDYPYEIVRWTENRNMQEFVKLIESRKLNIEKLITDNIDVDYIETAYTALRNRKTLGVIVNYLRKKPELGTSQQATACNIDSDEKTKFRPATKDHMKVGIIGAGGFSRLNLLPIIAQQQNVKINSVMDKDIADSLSVSKIYGATQCFTSYNDFFEKDSSDVVIISSEHKYHCAQALTAMQRGKAVFLEKPMATNFEQLSQIKNFLEKNPDAPFCVDYSRSFAPFIQKIKNVVKNRNSPLIINYRMNVELMDKNKFAQTDMVEGRIIGEACSIFDIFYFLTDSKPASVSVESLNTSDSQLFPTDNFCTQISFRDGSICSLVYTSLGNQSLGRERMEVFFETKSIVMQDYKILQGFGLRKSFDECAQYPDKGRTTLISNFFINLKNKKFKYPINLERLCDVANLTLTIDQLACKGGGSETMK